MASNEQPTTSGTQRTVRVKVQRRGKPAAPVSLDLRTPSGRRLPF